MPNCCLSLTSKQRMDSDRDFLALGNHLATGPQGCSRPERRDYRIGDQHLAAGRGSFDTLGRVHGIADDVVALHPGAARQSFDNRARVDADSGREAPAASSG